MAADRTTYYAGAPGGDGRTSCRFCGRKLEDAQGIASGVCGRLECHDRMIQEAGQAILDRKRAKHREITAEVLARVPEALAQATDRFGGADAAHSGFSPLQKAINHVMTSFLTTGGIRGSKRRSRKFEPRSFNMGLSKEAFQASGGFGKIHPGEDPDLSLRLQELGFKTAFIPHAEVYHKRRISWKGFYRQVRKFGLVRPILTRWHPESARLTFWFPTFFIAFFLRSVVRNERG